MFVFKIYLVLSGFFLFLKVRLLAIRQKGGASVPLFLFGCKVMSQVGNMLDYKKAQRTTAFGA